MERQWETSLQMYVPCKQKSQDEISIKNIRSFRRAYCKKIYSVV